MNATAELELSVTLENWIVVSKTVLHDELHCLDVPERIEYTLGVTMYRCLHGRAPRYLADHLIPVSDVALRRCRLRSANLNRLTVPRCPLKIYLDMSR